MHTAVIILIVCLAVSILILGLEAGAGTFK